jgi:hypothetical protein
MFAPWSLSAAPPESTADVHPKTFEEAFKEMDTNNDGVVDQAEAANASVAAKDVGLHKTFNDVDADKDGVITWDEGHLNNMVNHMDTNNNGVLEKDEVFERVVTVSFVLPNVDYEMLKADEELTTSLKDAVKGAIVNVAGSIFGYDAVDLDLSPGSVNCDATVTPPGNMSVALIHQRLNGTNALESAVAMAVAGLTGLMAVSTGGLNGTNGSLGAVPTILMTEAPTVETSDELTPLAEEAGFTPDWNSKDVNGDGVLTWDEVAEELLPTKDICGCTPQVKAECTCDGSLQFLACVEQNCPGGAAERCTKLSAMDWCGPELDLVCNGLQSTCKGKFHQAHDGIVGLTVLDKHLGDSVYCGPHGRCLGELNVEVEIHKTWALPNDVEGAGLECEMANGKKCTGPVEPGDGLEGHEGTAACKVSMVHRLAVGDKLKGRCWLTQGDAKLTTEAWFAVANDHKPWDGTTGLEIFPNGVPGYRFPMVGIMLTLAASFAASRSFR